MPTAMPLTPSQCSGRLLLTEQSGSVSSGPSNYMDNTVCEFVIQPTGGASAIELTFSSISTEKNYDYVKVFGGSQQTDPPLATFTGHLTLNGARQLVPANTGRTVPAFVRIAGSSLLVVLFSDASINSRGFSATYAVDGATGLTAAPANSSPCSGMVTLRASTGTISDGPQSYASNMACTFRINPSVLASTISLEFRQFDLEAGYNNNK